MYSEECSKTSRLTWTLYESFVISRVTIEQDLQFLIADCRQRSHSRLYKPPASVNAYAIVTSNIPLVARIVSIKFSFIHVAGLNRLSCGCNFHLFYCSLMSTRNLPRSRPCWPQKAPMWEQPSSPFLWIKVLRIVLPTAWREHFVETFSDSTSNHRPCEHVKWWTHMLRPSLWRRVQCRLV